VKAIEIREQSDQWVAYERLTGVFLAYMRKADGRMVPGRFVSLVPAAWDDVESALLRKLWNLRPCA
jgi:hypothetical protein